MSYPASSQWVAKACARSFATHAGSRIRYSGYAGANEHQTCEDHHDPRQLYFGRGEATSSRHNRLLLGEQIAKDILSPLPELKALVRIQDHGLHEGLGLLTTRFPNGFDGQASFHR